MQNTFYKNVIKTDASKNIYIAGATLNDLNNYDIFVVKYNSKGELQWMNQYNGDGDGDDAATGIFIDADENVYITGTITTDSCRQMVNIKYDSGGTQVWLRAYNGSGNLYGSGADITGDTLGNVYITGFSYNGNLNSDVITIMYDSTGNQKWLNNYHAMAPLNEVGVKVAYKGTDVL